MRKTGTWIWLDDCMAYCSECFSLGCGSNFCPNCGAKMDNVRDDDGDEEDADA